jgi:hypothetical protein
VILTALYVPESRALRARRIDPVGQVLVFVTLASLTYAIIEGPNAGWFSAQTVATFALALVALVSFILYEPRRKDPLIELRFFRSAPFSGATVIAVSAFAAFVGFLFVNTLYLQDVRGYSALDAGLCTLPLAAAALVCSPLSARLLSSRGARLPLLIAGGCMVASALVHAQRPGGRGGGGGIDEPPGRAGAGRGGDRLDRRGVGGRRRRLPSREREPSRLVGGGGLRCERVRCRRRLDGQLGTAHGAAMCGAAAGRAAGSAAAATAGMRAGRRCPYAVVR